MSESHRTEPVDLVINCFERTYRDVLQPGFISSIAQQNKYEFANRILILNNTDDPEHALGMANERLRDGEITKILVVADHIDQALAKTGLSKKALEAFPYYSNWALVAICADGSDWMLHWDADVRLEKPTDWITPSIAFVAVHPQVATVNPLWHEADLREQRSTVEDFILSYGFSDQVFLLRRSEFARPIYRYWVPISLRYPLAHISPYFEQWVDAYMRRTQRLRATYKGAVFQHGTVEGSAYPRSFSQRMKNAGRRLFVKMLRLQPWRHRYLRD